MQPKSQRRPRPNQRQRVFWFDLGRLLFPDLINKPRDMQLRMIIVTVTMVAVLVGAVIGFYHRVHDPADILLIQARETRR